MISGSTRLVALLGQPVAGSLSPRMQNAAFAARGLDWAYVACEVAPEALKAAFGGLVALGFAGANVTAPHKEAAADLCDEPEGPAVNTLAFRGAQHGAFYVADADCVGVTTEVPWVYNRQWLDLLARSGTMLFVSLAPDALGAAERRDLKEALALASSTHPLAEPLDWQRTVYPARWRLMGRERTYDWVGGDGAGLP